MRNFWNFLSKNNALLLFILFFTISVSLVIRNNSYQHHSTLNSTNRLVGEVYANFSTLTQYLELKNVNERLIAENAHLRTIILNSNHKKDTLKSFKIIDTLSNKQFTYLSARVIKNSILLRNNYITIDKGKIDGIEIGMPVVSMNNGVVGFVRHVSDHLAIIQSLLHKDTKISVLLKKSNAAGTLVWGEGNTNYTTAYVKEIPAQFKTSIKDTIETSGNGAFPKGILVGKVSKSAVITGDSFISLEINLFTNFSNLQYVYVIKNKMALEEQQITEKITNEQ